MDSFEQAMRNELAKLGADLPAELWAHIRWLEANGQAYRYRNSETRFLATLPTDHVDQLATHIVFELPPDLVRYWLGKDGFERQIIPILKVGGDGSYIALWRREGQPDCFVFLGSEGEAFVAAANALDLIAILSLGYEGIEGRSDLMAAPNVDVPPALTAWVQGQFGLTPKTTGAAYLPFDVGDDPFDTFITQETS